MFILLAQSQAVQVVDISAGSTLISPISTLNQLVQIGASAILLIGTLAVLYFLLYGAFNWIMAGGEKGKIEEARTMMTQGVIGLIVLAAVFVLFGMVLNFLGLRDRINIGNYGTGTGVGAMGTGTTGGTGGGGGTTINTQTQCYDGASIGTVKSTGVGAGYCVTASGAAAGGKVICLGPGASGYNYAAYSPCSCDAGAHGTITFQTTCQ